MELTELQIQQQPATLSGLSTGSNAPAETRVTSDVVIDGENVKVRSTTDFEKLLAELDSEQKENRVEARKSQLACALAAMTARYELMTAQEQAAVDAAVEAAEAVTAAEAGVASAQDALDASSAALAVATAELKALNEAYATTPEDREAEIEDEERAEEVETEERAVEEADQEQMDAAAIAEQQQKVDALQATVDADTAKLDEAKDELDAAEEALKTALAALDFSGYQIFVDAGLSAAKALRAAVAERVTDKALGAKVDGVIAALSAYSEQMEELQAEELKEKIMKISPDIIFLAKADYAIPAGELPQREEMV